MPSPRPRRWWRRGLVARGVICSSSPAARAFVLLHAPGNVSHPDLSFTNPSTTPANQPKRPHQAQACRQQLRVAVVRLRRDAHALFPGDPRPSSPVPHRVGLQRQRAARVSAGHLPARPCSSRRQRLGQGARQSTGKEIWHHKVGTLAAASPAVEQAGQADLVPTLSRHGRSPGGGAMLALSMKTGHIVWAHRLAAGGESSPIVVGTTRYFGDQGGNVYSLKAANGHVNWTYHAARPSRADPRSPAASCSSATTRAAHTPCESATATRSGLSAPTERISASARGTSTRRRRWRTAACTWATPTAVSTRSPRGPASWPGRPAPARTCMARRRRGCQGSRPDRLHRLL